jgi:hypothetical protein
VRIALAAALLLAAGCPTRQVELLPDAAVDQAIADGGADAAPDMAHCVCRFPCRASECPGLVGPGSMCVGQVCTGGTGSCTTATAATDCSFVGALCTVAPDSLTACP